MKTSAQLGHLVSFGTLLLFQRLSFKYSMEMPVHFKQLRSCSHSGIDSTNKFMTFSLHSHALDFSGSWPTLNGS